MKRVLSLYLVSVAVGSLLSGSATSADDKLDFNRDIRPILSANCFACHGPDAKHAEGDLRLDLREAAVGLDDEGQGAIVPGKPELSKLIHRINAADAAERMPPEESNKSLTAAEKEKLARWIREGAEYKKHWSLVPPTRPAVPQVNDAKATIRTPIDNFVVDRLRREGLPMSPEADRATLLRRVTLDLTGLPPTVAELEAFLSDNSPEAYERVVDRLLASPRYAERMAMNWLDLARYADTHGYNNDGERTQWPWRDWVINAFDTNMPYDQFIVDQLAGDLHENATPQQKLATGFNRNHGITSEGGIIEEEYRVEYVADRVHTTATVFLGLSMQCARCHDHKFDPITQRDYYRFFAFFNSVPESLLTYGGGVVPAAPFIKVPSPLQVAGIEKARQEMAAIEARRVARAAEVAEPLTAWEQALAAAEAEDQTPAGLVASISLNEGSGTVVRDQVDGTRTGAIVGNAKWTEGKQGSALEFDGETYVDLGPLVELERDQPFSISAWIRPTSEEPGTVVSRMDEPNAYRGFDLIIEQGRPAMHLIHHWPDNGIKVIAKQPVSFKEWHHLLVTYDGSSKAAGITLYVDGAAVPLETTNDSLRDTITTDKSVHLGRRLSTAPFRGGTDEVQFYAALLTADDARSLAAGQPLKNLREIAALPAAQRTPQQQAQLKDFYLTTVDEPYQKLTAELATATQRLATLEQAIQPTMIMEEMAQPRKTFILNRGEYDQPGESVTAGVPESLPPLSADAPTNRMGLARWMVDPANPLTARVAVNRWWQTYFGTGIVETSEDFGSQGAWPTHPELLDWLASELVSSGWDVKAMQKLMVMSATYRQSSQVSAELLERDPRNHLLARGPRYRLSAEAVRDTALAVSGLLVERVGGPSVYPYQPAGLWEEVSVERSASYKPGKGSDLYRRSMYTFWKRTCPPPAMTAFDAPDRDTCLIRRAETNTPLQALVLMNDPTYVEAARSLAARVLREGGETPETRLNHAMLLVVSRPARPAEIKALLPLVDEARRRFAADPKKAEELLAIGESPRDPALDTVELAAWSTLSSVLLNLDETICKE